MQILLHDTDIVVLCSIKLVFNYFPLDRLKPLQLAVFFPIGAVQLLVRYTDYVM